VIGLCQRHPVAAQPPLLLASTTSAATCNALRLSDVKPGALDAPHNDDQLAGLVMDVDDQRPGSPWGNSG
jgi:hypothetical protein